MVKSIDMTQEDNIARVKKLVTHSIPDRQNTIYGLKRSLDFWATYKTGDYIPDSIHCPREKVQKDYDQLHKEVDELNNELRRLIFNPADYEYPKQEENIKPLSDKMEAGDFLTSDWNWDGESEQEVKVFSTTALKYYLLENFYIFPKPPKHEPDKR